MLRFPRALYTFMSFNSRGHKLYTDQKGLSIFVLLYCILYYTFKPGVYLGAWPALLGASQALVEVQKCLKCDSI